MTKAKAITLSIEEADIEKLKNHPQNYREHTEDQLKHIIASIEKNGFYKNIVIAEDGTILAGHGVVKAAREMGMKTIPVNRLSIDPNSEDALKILTGDNEISRLAEIDDRNLSEILKVINDKGSLIGTGFDEMMLANLVMVTRPEGEIKDINEAAEWVGMPDFQAGESKIRLTVNFKTEEDRISFLQLIGQPDANQTRLWYPEKKNSDSKSVRFE